MSPPDNPYDRRTTHRGDGRAPHRGDQGGFIQFADHPGRPLDAFMGRPRLDAEDLDAIARRHHFLGHQEANEQAEARHAQAQQSTARRAWDEGFDAGAQEGKRVLLREMAAQFEGAVDDRITEAAAVLERVGSNRAITKDYLARRLRECQQLLEKLRHAHHGAFGTEIPF